jgi:hypothetical protein
MTYAPRKALKPEDVKRACGVHPQTFEKMLQVLREHEQRKIKPGRPPKLSLEDQLLMTLQYWREYRTYSISDSRGTSPNPPCAARCNRRKTYSSRAKPFIYPARRGCVNQGHSLP